MYARVTSCVTPDDVTRSLRYASTDVPVIIQTMHRNTFLTLKLATNMEITMNNERFPERVWGELGVGTCS